LRYAGAGPVILVLRSWLAQWSQKIADVGVGKVGLGLSICLFMLFSLAQSSSHSRATLGTRIYAWTEAEHSRGPINLNVSRGRTIRLSRPSATIFVADPTIADIQTPSNVLVFVFGKSPGRTSLFALDSEGNAVAEHVIIVTRPIEELRALLRSTLGDLDISVTYTPNGAVLSGTVPNAATAEQARAITAQFLGQGAVINNTLRVTGAIQVSLKVRVAEVSRSVTKEFGFNLSAVGQAGNFTFGLATGRQIADGAGQLLRSPKGAGSAVMNFSAGVADITAVLDALAAEGLVSILAEPSLTAVSGESASFLAGGEFPIPVSQGSARGNAVSVEFKRFGVSLDFMPTVLSSDLISIRVRPEVSDISSRGAVTIDGFKIPALTTRRAETVVELGSGQSFAIGGLIRKGFSTDISAFPGLGDLPILGALFRSSSFQKDESELVIIVTPYIVRPAARGTAMRVPTDRVGPPSDTDRVLLKTIATPPPPGRAPAKANAPRSLTENGFIVE
jgi:pilus assembly protein CpaC